MSKKLFSNSVFMGSFYKKGIHKKGLFNYKIKYIKNSSEMLSSIFNC